MTRLALALAIALLLTGQSLGATRPVPGGSDPRIQFLSYLEGEVYELPLAVGIVTTLVFDEEATLVSAQIGDSTSWDVQRLSGGRMLTLKPIRDDGATNMTVLDSAGRLYTFDLRPQPSFAADPPFRIHFAYPERDHERRQEKAREEARRAAFEDMLDGRAAANRDYTFAGSSLLRPTRMLDDGTRTYLSFPKNAPRPAIFIVNPDGTERIVEHRTVGGVTVLDLVGRQFTLRDGEEATCLFNKAYADGAYDDLAPAPEPEGTWLSGLFAARRTSDTGGADGR